MRLFTLTTLLALLATLVLAEPDTVTCRSSNWNGEQNRDIVQAINAFCGWTWDLVSTLRLPFSGISPFTHLFAPLADTSPQQTDRPQPQSLTRRL